MRHSSVAVGLVCLLFSPLEGFAQGPCDSPIPFGDNAEN